MGQSDYSMANEVLNKTLQKLSFENPECKYLSMNWGPWDGGMVNKSLKKEFQKRNIDLIDKKAGAYRVFITQACTATDAGTAYTVRVGKQKLKATAKATGGWAEFKKFDLGVVRLATPGRIEVVVSPDQAPSFAVMNLHSLQLVPVASP